MGKSGWFGPDEGRRNRRGFSAQSDFKSRTTGNWAGDIWDRVQSRISRRRRTANRQSTNQLARAHVTISSDSEYESTSVFNQLARAHVTISVLDLPTVRFCPASARWRSSAMRHNVARTPGRVQPHFRIRLCSARPPASRGSFELGLTYEIGNALNRVLPLVPSCAALRRSGEPRQDQLHRAGDCLGCGPRPETVRR